MKEFINIEHTRFASEVEVAAFVDILTDLLAAEGSTPVIHTELVAPIALDGNQFRVLWKGEYEFASPDGHYTFKDFLDTVEVEDQTLSFDTYTKLIGARHRSISRAYRTALRGIYNMTVQMTRPTGMGGRTSEQASDEYIRDTLEAALAEFPNSN